MDNQLKILIVDDNPADQLLLKRVVGKAGFATLTASSGQEGLELLKTESPQLILLDIEMDDLNGSQVLEAIRKDYGSLELPVIMISGHSDVAEIVDCLRLGANDYITKPCVPEIVHSRVLTQLRLAEASRETSALREQQMLLALVTTFNHEINNPLAIAFTCLDETDEITRERLKKSLFRIRDIVKKISEASREKPEYESYLGAHRMLKIKR